jgi:hypothetical protein
MKRLPRPWSQVATFTCLALLCAVPVTQAIAQQNVDRIVVAAPEPPPNTAATMLAALKTQATPDSPDAQPSPTMPSVWCADIPDAATKAACWRAYQSNLQYYTTGLNHRTKVFQWQHTSTIVIFITVLILVFAGLYFAWLQFSRDLKRPSAAPAPDSTLEMSATGLKISSPVLGVIILALSLAFFYLYLIYAYPIHELF